MPWRLQGLCQAGTTSGGSSYAWTVGPHCLSVCLSQIAMQALGFEPTKEELRTLEAELNVEGSGSIRFEDFLAIMSVKVVGLWGWGLTFPHFH